MVGLNGSSPAVTGAVSSGWLLELIRRQGGATRAQLQAVTGMSRTTLTERLDRLAGAGLIRQGGVSGPTGGRPATIIEFDERDKVVLTMDLCHTHARVAAVSLMGQLLAAQDLRIAALTRPEAVLAQLVDTGIDVLATVGSPLVVGIGLAVPAPVATGGVTEWSTSPMRGWSDAAIDSALSEHWSVPVVIENDARALALGEDSLREAGDSGSNILLGVKVATGIGAGVVVDGHPLRGTNGAAGDIGHTRVSTTGPRCRCGRRGCLAVYASGRALLRRLRHRHIAQLHDLVRLLDDGDDQVTEAVTDAGLALGHVLGGLVSAVNPGVVVLGGILGHHPLVVRIVRGEIKRCVIPRVSRVTTVEASRLGDAAGTVGLSRLVLARLYDPHHVDLQLGAHLGL
jgi:predicted NBD/HSP70 family sugar kinase